jgi:hypothetical protein
MGQRLLRSRFDSNWGACVSRRKEPLLYDIRMTMAQFYSWLEICGLLLAGTLATYYACNNAENRSRNAVISIVLLSLACLQLWGVS